MVSLRVATVCASNMNRSMEAHDLLARKGIFVKSYGTNTFVRLPGAAMDCPNVYDFSTSYKSILNDLRQKDTELYAEMGLLEMIERNTKIKERPERWQDAPHTENFDIIFTVEERVFNAVVEDFAERSSESFEAVHLVNIDVKDTHEDAVVGASLQLRLVQALQERGAAWGDEIDDVLTVFEQREGRAIMHQVLFY